MSQRAMSDEEAPFTSLHKTLYCDWYNTPIPFVEVSNPMIVWRGCSKAALLCTHVWFIIIQQHKIVQVQE